MKNLRIKEIKLFGDDDGGNTETPEQMEARLEEKYSGLKNNSASLVQEKRDLEEQLKVYKSKASEYERNLKVYKSKASEYERNQKMDKGQFEEVLEQERSDWKTKIDSHISEANKSKEQVTSLTNELKRFKIETAIKSAITKTDGFNVAATDDATSVALNIFNDFDDKNNPIIKDENGIIKTNKKGENYSPADFMNDQVEERSYWYNKRGGSGAGEGGADVTGTKQVSRSEWNIKLANATKEEKQELIQSYKNGNIEIV